MTLLNKISFEAGINPAVMNTLKESVEKLEYLDRHCIVMFDEMSLESSLHYDKKTDRVGGLEDLGSGTKKKIKNC